MQPDSHDAGKLWEMRRAAQDALEMAEGLTLEGLRADKKSRYAISKAIEVIGEEAGDVSKTFRLAHREIDWDGLIGMRHRLVHDYVRVRWERVWKLLQTEIPALIVKLDRIIPPDPGDVEVT
jgi:uncharacterized protein with HEPN domain